MHYVYLLQSQSHPAQHYIGLTSDLKSRLTKHNQGGVAHTSKFTPWTLQTYVAFTTRQQATAFERYLKSGSGRAFANRHLWAESGVPESFDSESPSQTSLLHQLSLLQQDVLSLAEAMPELSYAFAPVAGVRTFAEQAKHLATVIYLTTALIRQERSPHAPGTNNNGPDDLRTKAEILAYLREAFAHARATIEALTEASAQEPIPTYFGPQPRATVASGIIYHSYNHYGQMVVYARLCGIAPAVP